MKLKNVFSEIYERDLRRKIWLAANGSRTCANCGIPELKFYGEQGVCEPCFALSASQQMNNSL